MHFQPIVRIATGVPMGVEALVRWRHPSRGLLLPDEFIAFAEATGLIVPLGERVLREAIAAIAGVNAERPDRPLIVSINVSPRQLGDSGFVATVEGALGDGGFDPQLLWLEVTETWPLPESATVKGSLVALRDLGVTLALDDFGTGYASVDHLRRLEPDVIKIDRSFVSRLGAATAGTAIVRELVDLGRVLGMTVVAEGVESAEQLAVLNVIGCVFGQGYRWSEPLAGDALAAWLAAHSDPGPVPSKAVAGGDRI